MRQPMGKRASPRPCPNGRQSRDFKQRGDHKQPRGRRSRLVDSQNALKPQPSSGCCEIQILTNSHKSVRPVRVASFPRKPRIRSGDSTKTTNVGINKIIIIMVAMKFRRVRVRNISTTQNTNITIRDVDDLAANARPTNTMIIAAHERRWSQA